MVIKHYRKKPPTVIQAQEEVVPEIDMNDANLVASSLPGEEWLRLAAEYAEKGDLRLALRARYFAMLVFLSEENLISIVKSKSNLEYFKELRRRGHSLPRLVEMFREAISIFDRVWYGDYEVTPEIDEAFIALHGEMLNNES